MHDLKTHRTFQSVNKELSELRKYVKFLLFNRMKLSSFFISPSILLLFLLLTRDVFFLFFHFFFRSFSLFRLLSVSVSFSQPFVGPGILNSVSAQLSQNNFLWISTFQVLTTSWISSYTLRCISIVSFRIFSISNYLVFGKLSLTHTLPLKKIRPLGRRLRGRGFKSSLGHERLSILAVMDSYHRDGP